MLDVLLGNLLNEAGRAIGQPQARKLWTAP
jgi:hypothetical protein